MGMHISMVWFVTYNLLNLVTTYCSLLIISTTTTNNNKRKQQRPRRRHHAGIERTSNGVWDYGYTNRSILIDVALRYTKELVTMVFTTTINTRLVIRTYNLIVER
jgi:hypothetical protein